MVMHIYLIGYRGTGKSTVGRLVAAALGRPFHDADIVLEHAAERTIAEIFASEGEVGFRDRESTTLAELASRPPAVIATGGGIILRESNREILRFTGFVVWLTAAPETLWQRIQGDATTAARRPNLTATGGLAEVINLLAAREPHYRATAHRAIEAEARSPEAIAADILTGWHSFSTSP